MMSRAVSKAVGRFTQLKRHYFKKLSKAISPKTAAKFFRVKNRIPMLIDLQIVSELPLVK